MPPAAAAPLLAARPIRVLEVWPIIAYSRFRRMELEPFPASGGRVRVWLPRHCGGQFQCIRHCILEQATRFSLRTNRGVVSAGCLNPLDHFCVRGHGFAPDTTIVANSDGDFSRRWLASEERTTMATSSPPAVESLGSWTAPRYGLICNGGHCRPSISVNPYSGASCPTVSTRPDLAMMFWSAASATTARPMYSGDSRLSGAW